MVTKHKTRGRPLRLEVPGDAPYNGGLCPYQRRGGTMQQGIPTEETVLEYFSTLSNWGRWGVEDQLGTLNSLTPEKTRRAVGLVREGVTISCARTIRYDAGPDSPAPPIHYMVESGEGWASGEKVSNRRNQASVDFFGMVFHGHTITHLDSLAHFFWEGKMYNGRPAHLVSTSLGRPSNRLRWRRMASSRVVCWWMCP